MEYADYWFYIDAKDFDSKETMTMLSIVLTLKAGGIKTARDALEYQILMNEELGEDWLMPNLFRFGASSLLTDIERQLEHHATGRYSATYRHPMG